MNLKALGFNSCLSRISNVCSIFKSKDYLIVKDNELQVRQLNFLKRIFRYLGCYSSTHKDNLVKQVCPLLLTDMAIPEKYEEVLQNLVRRYVVYSPLNTRQNMEFAGESIEVVHSIDYPQFILNDNSYEDEERKQIIPQRTFNLASRTVSLSWSFSSKCLFEFYIEKINENTFIFDVVETFGDYPEQDNVAQQCKKWAVSQMKAILTNLAFDLRQQGANILYISNQSLEEPVNVEYANILKEIGVQFDQQIFQRGEQRPCYLYKFTGNVDWENARRINNISLAFSLGIKPAHSSVKSAVVKSLPC